MNEDILAFLPWVVERLKQSEGIKKVFEAKELSELDTGKQIAPLDGCVYVVLDSVSPNEAANRGKNYLLDIDFSVILVKHLYNQDPSWHKAGKILTKVCQSLIGCEPKKDGKHLTTSPIVLNGRASVLYQKGYALYPLRFTTQVVVYV